MISIQDANKEIQVCSNANNYPELINKYGYTFTYVEKKERRIIFIGTRDGQIVLDFQNKIFYKCYNFEITTLAYIIYDDDFTEIIHNWNKEQDFKNIPQDIRVANIVRICLGTQD